MFKLKSAAPMLRLNSNKQVLGLFMMSINLAVLGYFLLRQK